MGHIASGSAFPAVASCTDHTSRLNASCCLTLRQLWLTHGVLVSFFGDVSLIATIIPTIVVSYTFAYLSHATEMGMKI